MIYKKTT